LNEKRNIEGASAGWLVDRRALAADKNGKTVPIFLEWASIHLSLAERAGAERPRARCALHAENVRNPCKAPQAPGFIGALRGTRDR